MRSRPRSALVDAIKHSCDCPFMSSVACETDPEEFIEQSRLPAQIVALRLGLQVYPILREGLVCELPVRGLMKRRRFGIRGSRLKASIRSAGQVVGGVGTDRVGAP